MMSKVYFAPARAKRWDYSASFLRILAESLGVDGQLHVDAAAQIGLGSQEYEWVQV